MYLIPLNYINNNLYKNILNKIVLIQILNNNNNYINNKYNYNYIYNKKIIYL